LPGLLFLHGGPEAAHAAYRQGHADWSAALPVVLEKLGYLAFDARGPEGFADMRRYDAALIARMPLGWWTPERVDVLLESRVPVLLEGPVPAALGRAVGVRDAAPLEREGRLMTSDRALADAAAAYGQGGGTRIQAAISRPVDRDAAVHWTAVDGVPITEAQAAAWREPAWNAESWQLDPDVEVLAEWLPETRLDERLPGIVRRGSVTACAFGLFAFLVQAHTSEPTSGAEFRSGSRCVALEHLLMAILDDLHARAGAVRARIRPWPRGAQWILNVRHDFDRFLTPVQVSRILLAHDRAGSAATWYWRARHLDEPRRFAGRLLNRANASNRGGNAAVRLVDAHPRHEVALHTERLWNDAEHEKRLLERVVGHAVEGTSAHGDPQCFRYQGAPNVLWADRHGLAYTEMIQHAHLVPHRFPALAPDGTIDVRDVICLPHHESFDGSMNEGDVRPDAVMAAAELYRSVGGMLQVMNHPDVHHDELFATLEALPRAGRLSWTAAEAASWWRRSHTASELGVQVLDDGDIRLSSRSGLSDVVIELRDPAGATRDRVATVAQGGTTVAFGFDRGARAGRA
jgi:hypothetical protein